MKFDEEKMIKNIAKSTGISEEMINEAIAYAESQWPKIEAALSSAHDRSEALEKILLQAKERNNEGSS